MNYPDRVLEYLKNLDRRTRLYLLTATSLLMATVLLLSIANGRIGALSRKKASRESDLAQMVTLRDRCLAARLDSQRFSSRLSGSHADDSPARIVEETGVRGKSLQVTPLKTEQRETYREEVSQVKLEAVTPNEAVNLVYRIEHGSRPVVMKRVLFKTRFDDASRLDVTLDLAVLKPVSRARQ